MKKRTEDVSVTVIGLGSWQGHAHAMARPHRHDEVELNLIEDGSMTYLFGGRQAVIPAGRLGAFWAGVPHQLVSTTESARCHWATLPLAWFLQWRLPESFAQRIMRGDVVVEGDPGRAVSDAASFKRWAEDMAADSAERRAIFLLEVEARLRRLALSATERAASRTRPSPGSGGVNKVEEMARFIAENYPKSLRIADIAAAAGLHPNYAMALFRRTFGISLLQYAMQHRISHAQRLLLTSDAKVLDIALESGFGSLSRFYAVFTRACKQSPKEYRRSLRTGMESRGKVRG